MKDLTHLLRMDERRCISYFSHHFEKIPDKSNFKEGFILAHNLGDAVHHGGKGVLAAPLSGWCHSVHSQGAVRGVYWCSAHMQGEPTLLS